MRSPKLTLWFRNLAGLFVAVILIAIVPAHADSFARIVRLSYVEGEGVQIDRNDGSGFSKAYANEPLQEGMRLYTSDNTRAEVEFEDGSNIRMTPNSLLAFPELRLRNEGYRSTLVDVKEGLVYFNIQHRDRNEVFRVVFSEFQVDVTKAAHFRMDGDLNELHVSVTQGSINYLDFNGERSDIRKNETLSFDMTDTSRPYRAREVASLADDTWNHDREEAIARAQAASTFQGYSSNYSYGFADLNKYGSYYNDSRFGAMWRPYNVGYEWDPFDAGYWVYYPNSGYVWVSAYPWGWAPYRYGSWVFLSGRGWYWRCQPNYYQTIVYVPVVVNPPVHYVVLDRPRRGDLHGTGSGIGVGTGVGIGSGIGTGVHTKDTVIVVDRSKDGLHNTLLNGDGIPKENGGTGGSGTGGRTGDTVRRVNPDVRGGSGGQVITNDNIGNTRTSRGGTLSGGSAGTGSSGVGTGTGQQGDSVRKTGDTGLSRSGRGGVPNGSGSGTPNGGSIGIGDVSRGERPTVVPRVEVPQGDSNNGLGLSRSGRGRTPTNGGDATIKNEGDTNRGSRPSVTPANPVPHGEPSNNERFNRGSHVDSGNPPGTIHTHDVPVRTPMPRTEPTQPQIREERPAPPAAPRETTRVDTPQPRSIPPVSAPTQKYTPPPAPPPAETPKLKSSSR